VDRTAARGNQTTGLGECWAFWWRRLLMNLTSLEFSFLRSASDGVLDLWVFLLSELASSVASLSLLTMLWESVFVSFEHSFTWSCMPPGWVGALWWW
jgi:hypothetical protein